MSYVDLTIGIPGALICIELFLISIYLAVAYTWKPYVLPSNSTLKYHGELLGLGAVLYTLNPLDVLQSFFSAFSPSSNRHSYQGNYLVPPARAGQPGYRKSTMMTNERPCQPSN